MNLDERRARFRDVAIKLNNLRYAHKMTLKNVRDGLSHGWNKIGVPDAPTANTLSQIISDTCVVMYKGFVDSKMRLGYKDKPDCPNCPFYNSDLGGSCTIGAPVAHIFNRFNCKRI